MSEKGYLGITALVIFNIAVACVLLLRRSDTEPKVVYKAPSAEVMRQVRKANALKRPPPGETYATGHWHGDAWHRTVPPDPEAVSVDGEMWTYADLRKKLSHPDDRWKAYQKAVEAYPYSEIALEARYDFMKHDENRKRVYRSDAYKLEKYKEMLVYHPDSPRLLQDLAQLTERDAPEEAIFYAKEALKYVDVYPSNTWYGLWTEPEEIHRNLGMAYQRVGDYESALVHLKETQALIEANPDRTWGTNYADVIGNFIEAIENGNPIYGPPSEGDPLSGIDASLLDPFNLPPVSDFDAGALPESDVDVPLDPVSVPAEPVSVSGVVADGQRVAAAEQARAAFEKQQQQEFDEFVQWMEEIERAASPTDLEDFWMREMAKQLQGNVSEFTPEQLVEAFRMRHHRDGEGGIRPLPKRAFEVAEERSRQRSQRPRRTNR